MPTIIDLATLTPQQGFNIIGAGSPGSAPQPNTIDQAGRSVSSAGDVNGDGIDDFIIGAPFFDVAVPNPLPGPVPGEDTGAAYIIYGRTGATRGNIDLANLSATDGFRIEGEAKNHYAGTSVSAAGDVNGDGIDDFLVGARYGSDTLGGFEGRAYVVYGKLGTRGTLQLSALTAAEGFSIQGDATFDYIGTAVAAAGDVNGDGFDDIVLGAPNGESSGSFFMGGEVYVIFGRGAATRPNIDLSNFSNSDGFLISGNVIGRFVGVSVAGAGDVNGDGFDDIIFGSLLGGISNYSTYGSQAFIVYGQTGATRADIDLRFLDATQGFTVRAIDSFDRTGFSVSSAGDINGDGIDDVLVGAPQGMTSGIRTGLVYVVYGQTAARGNFNPANFTPDQGFIIQGDGATNQAGFSVSAAGDINGDGIADIIIGSPYSDNGGVNAGNAYVIFGKSGVTRGNIQLSTLLANDGFVIQGEGYSAFTGQSVSGAGDVNNDGFDDLIVGSPFGGSPRRAGEAYIIFGSANLSPPTPVTGTASADILTNPIGNNIIDGLGGFDTLDMSAFTSAITLNTITGTIVSNQGGSDTVINVEAFNLGSGNDIILLGNGGFTVRAGAGNDQVAGGTGNDSLEGGAGDDVINGGGGVDTASYVSNAGAIFLDLAGGYALETGRQTGTVTGAEVRLGLDSLSLIENVIGSAYGDRLYGDNFVNRLEGGAGDDIIYGEGGDDVLLGGLGSDVLIGGAGSDGIDYSANSGAVYIELGSGFVLETALQAGTVGAGTALLSTDLLAQIENANGSAFGDRIYGSNAANLISAGAGDDIVYAEGGDDIVIGGAGSDILLGGTGTDTLDYSGAVGAVFADLAGFVIETGLQVGIVNAGTAALSTDLLAQFENITGSAFGDRLYGDAGANVLRGLAGDDILYGGGGADVLIGGDGVDRLIGEAGADTLTGGLGADRFLFSTAPGTGTDTITDFSKSEGDQLFFLRSAFGLAPADPLTLVVNGAAVAAHSFLYNSTTGILSYDADGAGGAAAIDVVNIGTGVALTSGDMVLYG